jgi:hypothetical protein
MSFLESKLESDFSEFYQGLDIPREQKLVFNKFIEKLKEDNQVKIVSEIKYRLTDGEDLESILIDILDNKLSLEYNTSQFTGRSLVMNMAFDRLEKTQNIYNLNRAKKFLSVYKSDGFNFLKNKLGDKINLIIPYLEELRRRYKQNQDIFSWVN